MDSTNAYIYGPGNTPIEQVNLTTGNIHIPRQRPPRIGPRHRQRSDRNPQRTTSYDAWGNPQTTGGLTAATPFGYAGYYTDPTGLNYNIGRYYDPTTGQFLTIDPLPSRDS